MTIAHVIYIPLCTALGLLLGWVLGSRGAASELERLRQQLEQAEQDASRARVAKSASE